MEHQVAIDILPYPVDGRRGVHRPVAVLMEREGGRGGDEGVLKPVKPV